MSEQDQFPVESFREAYKPLRAPFSDRAVKFKIQQQLGTDKGLIVAYIDARLVIERLNLVVGGLWWDNYERIDGKHLACRLTVFNITREDVGRGPEIGKDAYSDALKRAAVKFGVGVSLYALPAFILDASRQAEKGKLGLKQKQGGKAYMTIPPSTDTHLRQLYTDWLQTEPGKTFGDPLDHGDPEEGAVGDLAESEHPQLADGESFDAPRAEKQKAEIDDLAEVALDRKTITKTAIKAMVQGAEGSNEELQKIAEHLREKAGLPA